jgi:mRNA interferase RelE/StbE
MSLLVAPRHKTESGLAYRDNSGYNMARMRYDIILSAEAVEDLGALRADVRATVRDAIEQHLRHEPAKVSKSRIKRLRGLSRPQYRLRMEQIRVFYDLTETAVEVLAIVAKDQAGAWLKKVGESHEESSPE